MLHVFAVLRVLMSGCDFPPDPPIPPAQCKRMETVCVCDQKGHCHFEFVCVK